MRVIVAGRLSRKVQDRDQTGLDSQEREAVRWAESEGHEVVAVVADFAKGTSTLWSRKNLRPWVTDPEMIGRYDAIVALKVDRLTRADDQGVDVLKAWARENGKQLLISSAAVKFPSEGRDGIAWDLYIRMAHDEWLSISERYSRMQANRREVGSAIGRIPWGFRIAKAGGVKIFEPTETGITWAPQVFMWVAAGVPLRTVASRLNEAGVLTHNGEPWADSSLRRIIRNPIYKGARRNSGALKTVALIDPTLWATAGASMTERAGRGRGTAVNAPALARPTCWACYGVKRPGCPDGIAPMYRVYIGVGSYRRSYYRCAGAGQARSSCGAKLIRCNALDELITAWLSASTAPYRVRTYVPGVDVGKALDDLDRRIKDALSARDFAAVASLSAEAEALQDAESTKARWDINDSGLTMGEHFGNLGCEERRDYLASLRLLAVMDPDGIHLAEHVTDEGEYLNMWTAEGTAVFRTREPMTPYPVKP